MVERVINQRVTPKSKRLWRRIFTPRLVFCLGILVLAMTGIFAYFYVIYSEMIDAKLQGDIFVRATGIYTAPVKLRVGPYTKKAELTAYLDHIGYINDAKLRDPKRGFYTATDNLIEIDPSDNTNIDEQIFFPHLQIKFSKDGKNLNSIYDLDSKKELSETIIEPELLTSVNSDKEKRKNIEYKDLPQELVNAIVSIEDRRFFDHPGIDFRGLARAIWRNLSEGEVQQGGSTVTQQLVKNFFLTSERTFKRKFSEAFISVLLETRLEKKQIFQMYCNEIYLGQDGSYSINGFGEAAKFYFNKDVSRLNLSESAFLAGIIRGPGYYSPFQHADRAIQRRNQVIDSMVVANFLDPQKAEEVKKSDLQVRPKSSSSNAEAPYFLDYLQTKVNEELGDQIFTQNSYRIYSTIDMDLQRAADQALRNGLAQLEKDNSKRFKPGSLQAALIAINPKTGEILAMVGGRDYSTSQLNRAIEARRQPGSVFKPIVYTAALNTAYEEKDDKIITASSQFLDDKATFSFGEGKTYEPDNYGEKYTGENVSLRYALTKSLNVVTVRVAEQTGYNKVAKMAERLGLPKPQPFPSIALGTTEATPFEVARAYTTFPNLGTRVEPFAINRVVNSDSKTIYQGTTKNQQSISPQVAFIMNSIMQDVMNKGTGARARTLGFNALAAGKTGTSRDGWFAGFTPNLVCVVYVGLDDNSQLGIEGSKSALPIWTEFMKKALAKRPDLGGQEFPSPKTGLTQVTIDAKTGLLSAPECGGESYDEYFITGTEPKDYCSTSSTFPVDDGEEGYIPPDNDTVSIKEDDTRPRRQRVIKQIFKEIFKKNN
ncbi:MAG: PBP1A family penicillin-binding protein [Blastocatellia bacterium]|nr:PBP1A family penicillin-binding protein [Blastocatellia bacterium]